MSAFTKQIVRFVLIFLIALAALVAVWGVVAPSYSAAVSTLARPGFRFLEPDHVTILATQGNELWVYRRVGEREIAPFTFFDRYAFFAVIPLVALVLATPGLRWTRRLVALAVAVAAQLVAHAVLVVASIELAYAGMGLTAVAPAATGAGGGIQILVRVLWEASPLVLWIALTAGAWKKAWRKLCTPQPARVSISTRRTGVKERGAQLREGRTT